MFCSKCGKPIVEESRFCSNCGTASEKQNVNAQKHHESCCDEKINIPIPQCPTISIIIIIYTVLALFFEIWVISLIYPKEDPLEWYLHDFNYNGYIDEYDKEIAEESREITARNLNKKDRPSQEDIINAYLLTPLLIFSPTLIYGIYFWGKYSEYKLAKTNYPEYIKKVQARIAVQTAREEKRQAELDAEYQAALASQNRTEPWAVRYSTSACPHCGHYKVRIAKWDDKRMSVAFWGAASDKIGKNYICDNCKSMW